MKQKLIIFAAYIVCSTYTTFAQGTAFTYQGRLNAGTNPTTGSYDLGFALFTNSVAGNAVAGPITNFSVVVSNGLFTVKLDFGPLAFNGSSNYLQLSVRTNNGSAFATLSPRQQITPVPYAIFATSSGTAAVAAASIMAQSVSAGSVTGTGIASGTITTANIAAGQVVKSINALKDNVALVAGTNISITTNANGLEISAASIVAASTSGCCVFSERPRFVFYNEGNSTIASVTNSLGYLGRIDWLVTEYVPSGQSSSSLPYVSISIDDDAPQTLYLKTTVDTTRASYPIYDSNSVQIGSYYEWSGSLTGTLSFTNKLLLSCNYPTALCPAPVGSSELNPEIRCGFVRAIYVLRK